MQDGKCIFCMQVKLLYWYIASKMGVIDNFKIKLISFVLDSGSEMTVYVKFEV